MSTVPEILPSELVTKLLNEKKIARDFQERRHEDWNDNYELYRNKVKTNRLTQRQAVNIPLMKETVKTLLSKIDDPPQVDWQELSGDEFKEIVVQEMWNADYERLNMEGIDAQDKKTALLYGRPFKKLNWVNGQIDVRALDIFDVVIDPLTDPLDIETARYVVHQNIFRPLRDILADPRYSKEAKKKLNTYIHSQQGIIQSGQNKEEFEKKMERLVSMGVEDRDFAMFAGGDAIVNLTEHISHVWDAKQQKFVRRVIVYADDTVELLDIPLKEALGVDFYPYVTWSEDIETNDFWTDGPADLVRTPNKVLNVWWSQLVENRTLRNFQMHWYDASIQGYSPSTYEPGPGRMLPAPGDPSKTIKPVEISGLDETLQAVDFLIRLVERGTSATSIEKGVSEQNQQTLGEVEILVGKAMERTVAMAKFYRRSWLDLANKWYALMDANQNKKLKLYKTGADGKLWPKTVYPKDWKSEAGFRPIVRSTSEQESEKTKSLQRFMGIRAMFPNNRSLNRIIQQRAIELVDLTPAEMKEVEEEEKKNQEMLQQQLAMQAAQPVQGTQPTPAQPQMMNPEQERSLAEVQGQLSELTQLQNG